MTVHDLPPPLPSDDEGALPRTLRRMFGRSWKTSACGLLGIAAAVLPFIPGIPPAVLQAAQAAQPFIIGGGLMLAKDGDVTHSGAKAVR